MGKSNKNLRKYIIPASELEVLTNSLGFVVIDGEKQPTHKHSVINHGFDYSVNGVDEDGNEIRAYSTTNLMIDIVYDCLETEHADGFETYEINPTHARFKVAGFDE